MQNYNDILHQISYNTDASHIDSNEPLNVFFPNNDKQIIETLQKAIDENKKIILRGAGTNLVGNCLPIRDCFVIDLSKLDNILEYNEDSVVVQPGVILDNLNEHLQKENKIFPINIGSHLVAQIGSMIATNAAGMKAMKYGNMQDRINWIEVMYIDKNKQIQKAKLKGEEMRDFVGSEGILGVITKANLKIIDKPIQKSISFFYFDTLGELIDKTKECREYPQTVAIEYLDKIVAGFLGLENKYCLFVEFEDENFGEIKDPEEIQKTWKLRDSCYSVIVSKGYECIEDPQVDLDQAVEILSWLEKNQTPTFGHIGIGILHPHFQKKEKDLTKQMYQKIKEIGGKVSGEHGIGIKKKEFLTEEEKNRFQKIKDKYNPHNIFGGNNIVG